MDNHRRLHLFAKSVKDYAILMLDIEGRVISWNAGAERIKGYTSDEIIGRHFSCFYTVEDRESGKPEALLRRACEEGSVSEESWRVRKNGSRFWGDVDIVAIRSEGGHLIGYTKVVRDLTERKRAEQALRQSEERFRTVIEATTNALILADGDGIISLLNSQAEKVFGYTREELYGKSLEILIPEELRQRHMHNRLKYQGSPQRREMGGGYDVKGVRKDGTVVPLEIGLNPITTAEGHYVLASIIDITERKREEAQLRLIACVFENASEGILITDGQKRIIDVNRAYCDMTGYLREELLGKSPKITSSGRHDESFYRSMWSALERGGRWNGEIWDRRRDGKLYPTWLSINEVRDGQGHVTNYIGIFSDISILKQAEEKLSKMAFYDPLTNLPNRALFQDRLDQEIADCRRYNKKLAVMFIDLDRFKYVNDTLGHSAGDLLLIEVADRLKKSLRENDTVARWGGDEFTVILKDVHDSVRVSSVAQSIIRRLDLPVILPDQEVFIGASLGISLYPDDGSDFDTLTKNADAAMYNAKDAGRGVYLFFTESMNRRSRNRLSLENSLHRALKREEFCLYYQPQLDIVAGRLISAEALIRWKHPEEGLVSPIDFIPLAEENSLILPIGEWVLREVCRHIRSRREMGLPDLRIAVNLSPRQFRQKGMVENLITTLSQMDVEPPCLELEITEGTVMEIADAAVGVLNRLHQHGFVITIDDFGTGYSSLSYLKRFPVDRLKIDRSFVTGIPGDPNDVAITIAIIQLAKSLGMQVIAEGVETNAQRLFLMEHGCDQLQGFWYSEPLDGEAFEEFILRMSTSEPLNHGNQPKQ
jgi:diguanylate cyclase (GGDEF)-like protein/PAS domain S-box-containing protein